MSELDHLNDLCNAEQEIFNRFMSGGSLRGNTQLQAKLFAARTAYETAFKSKAPTGTAIVERANTIDPR